MIDLRGIEGRDRLSRDAPVEFSTPHDCHLSLTCEVDDCGPAVTHLFNGFKARPWALCYAGLQDLARSWHAAVLAALECQLSPGQMMAAVANGDMRSFLRREVETVAASIPQQAASPPVQLIIQNSSSVSSTQPEREQLPPQKVPQHLWQLSRQDLSDFWSSPLNRAFPLHLVKFLNAHVCFFKLFKSASRAISKLFLNS
ncbi:unnamed protein product [Cladocopium goreaui]|uniref:Uncharacterized protein n=1 Tax=Cladocopium goreaui TaxID=2562237 RepID=A0A9P1M436_9DINO|nr:unnamed protein product [Cladocopium goreaui]